MTKKFFAIAAVLMTMVAMVFTSCEKNNDPWEAEIARVKAASMGSWIGERIPLVGDPETVTVTFTETNVTTSEEVSAKILEWKCNTSGKVYALLDDEFQTKLFISVNGNQMVLEGNSTFFLLNFPTTLTKVLK